MLFNDDDHQIEDVIQDAFGDAWIEWLNASFIGQLPQERWPSYLLKHRDVVEGVYIGECASHHPFDGALAHAHTRNTDDERYWGSICFLNPLAFVKPLVLHEIAHLIANADHNGKWRRTLRRIDGTLDEVYIPRLGLTLRSHHKVIRKEAAMRRQRRAFYPPKGK